jgi:hypothetical protein
MEILSVRYGEPCAVTSPIPAVVLAGALGRWSRQAGIARGAGRFLSAGFRPEPLACEEFIEGNFCPPDAIFSQGFANVESGGFAISL